ncbi:MAG: tryptophan synthase subunit alpha [Deltaproteobacteria bacterium]|nr:tryptophan synthase subunit alpha [Deltaproteobacteria bacterium]
MSRIQRLFENLKQQNEKALIPYITAGDPDIATTEALLKCLVDNGADMIELGVPFSDPMADGPTIQAASQRALQNPFSMETVLELVRKVRTYSDIPIILFGYFNPFLQYGLEKLCREAQAAGADGFLVVDLPPEEAADFKTFADAGELDLIFLLAPTSTDERMRLVAENGGGFIYFVSVTGVTGARDDLDSMLGSYVEKIRSYTSLPIGIGFGISKPEHVKEVSAYADAVIVGSAIIKVAQASIGRPDMLTQVASFVRSLKAATKQQDV